MNYLLLTFLCCIIYSVSAQDKGTFIFREPGYLQNVILKGTPAEQTNTGKPKRKVFVLDQSTLSLPNKKSLYTSCWHNAPISQGSTGTCWCYSTLSFYESEIKRITGREIKLSEMFIVYHEYLAKAERFIDQKGKSLFDEGSEANAVKRMIQKYGVVPLEAYPGKADADAFHFHDNLVADMKAYLDSLKKNDVWNKEQNIKDIERMLEKHLGVLPQTFTFEKKTFTPQSFRSFLKFNPDEYIDILSYKQEPFNTFVEYKVPDNWWHDSTYYNIPLDTFMRVLKQVISNGYSVVIGGDISEPGISMATQCALIPSFDIPSSAINDDARQFRFSNYTTTDDHGMHIVGYTLHEGRMWFLFKDSGSGSRNNDINAPEFGYYFVSEDYIKLKMMDFQVHRSALKDLIPELTR